jgi:transcription-repair coupling factor (superfamily II helicase)
LVVPSLGSLPARLEAAEGFSDVCKALLQGRSATIDGTWGSSAALSVAALVAHAQHPVVVVLAHPRELDGWTADLTSFVGKAPTLFPAWDHAPSDHAGLDETAGQRLRLLTQLGLAEPPRLLLTTLPAVMQPVPERARLDQNRRTLRAGATIDPEELAAWLVGQGFRRGDAVELPGEFSRRGGILDIYPPDAEAPYRLEFFGDELESVRQFSAQTQRSLGTVAEVVLLGMGAIAPPLLAGEGAGGRGGPNRGHLCDYLPAGSWTILVEPGDLREAGRHYLDRVGDVPGLFAVEATFQQLIRFPSVTLSTMPSPTVEAACHLRVESVERFSGDVARVREELRTVAGADQVIVACHNEAECQRLGELLHEGNDPANIHLVVGQVTSGFRMVDAGLVVLGDHELFRRADVHTAAPRRRVESRAIDSFLDLAEGDLVVHISHGIGRFRGMQLIEKNGHAEEHLCLEFRDGIRLFVPASKIDLVQKYVGGTRTEPELAKLGGTSWQHKKARVEAATLDLASEMVQLQALRDSQPGYSFPPDSDWQREFEGAFPFQETPDQLSSLVEIKRDLERARPMDRLVCGDVGYGKTELALRAAFKTVDNGRQVAILVPTTVLAEQHFRTFRERFAEYPFVVESLSRFRTGGEQKRVIERLGQGGVDVVVGTHRLVSADVKFKDLGLVIIDEEQRFGVDHKERLKRLRQTVDVLTLTATPIPRTLHLALLGIRDISNLETPPANRLAIETRIARYDKTLIRHAIVRELNREGQIYFVHNRVHDIQAIVNNLKSIVPEARIVVAHGQMPEGELEEAMTCFVRHEADILVATTIIESGLDIPNVNTIFINQADQYGLADLHQLRGRVGRYKHRAYAYLLLDPSRSVSSDAGRRLKAIEEYTELGAGFKIALRDLEIRGAGNILGTQQSGHIAAVGYEMYCQLLENSVRQLKNQPKRTPLEVNVELPWPAFLPTAYVGGIRQRIEVYRRLARVRSLDRLEDFRQELRDRFGAVPETAEWMLRLAELRLLANRWQVDAVHLEGQGMPANNDPLQARVLDVVLSYRSARLVRRLAERSEGRLRVVDEKSAYFRLLPEEREAPALYECLKDLLRLPTSPV